jgi:hypothetical protein
MMGSLTGVSQVGEPTSVRRQRSAALPTRPWNKGSVSSSAGGEQQSDAMHPTGRERMNSLTLQPFTIQYFHSSLRRTTALLKRQLHCLHAGREKARTGCGREGNPRQASGYIWAAPNAEDVPLS